MKKVNPNDSSHSIKLVPRFYEITSLDLSLYNEATQETTNVTDSYSVSNGILTLNFDFDFENNDKYQFVLLDGEDVVYRDKLIATNQETQDYKLTTGLYTYE